MPGPPRGTAAERAPAACQCKAALWRSVAMVVGVLILPSIWYPFKLLYYSEEPFQIVVFLRYYSGTTIYIAFWKVFRSSTDSTDSDDRPLDDRAYHSCPSFCCFCVSSISSKVCRLSPRAPACNRLRFIFSDRRRRWCVCAALWMICSICRTMYAPTFLCFFLGSQLVFQCTASLDRRAFSPAVM